MRILITQRNRVTCHHRLTLPRSAAWVWNEIRDFARYAAHDHFHYRFEIAGPLAAGSRLRIGHRYLGFQLHRVGRICWWQDGVGYAFSDLSRAGPLRAFPHVFRLKIVPVSNDACHLDLSVTGKWTARLVPRPLRYAWLWWVFAAIVLRTHNQLLKRIVAEQRMQTTTAPAAKLSA